jgi:hypothetical protein
MKFRLAFFCVLFFGGAGAQVYSPYYFLDTLKDKGITSEIHKTFKNKIYFEQEYSSEEQGSVKDASKNVLQFNKGHNIKSKLFLDRSLRYYYAKYQSDPKLTFEDWNYYSWKGNYDDPDGKKGRYVGCLLFVMTVDGDTVCTWKTSLFEGEFENNTEFSFYLWDENNKSMGEKAHFWPLFSYLNKKGKSGLLNIRIDVYPGKLTCNSIADRGPDLLCTGTVKFEISKTDLDVLKELKDESYKLKFQDYDLENELLWVSKH